MLSLLNVLLRLYPAEYRAEFGEEMLDVLGQAMIEARRRGRFVSVRASMRESAGLVRGAMKERIRYRFGKDRWFQLAKWRFNMRSEFRYPRAAAPMMALIFAGIMLVIYKARAVQIGYADVPSFEPLTFGLALLIAGAAGVVGWLILYWLHRSGVHRLAEAQTWPQAK